MFEILLNPLVLGLIVVALIVAVAIVVMLRRRRAASEEVLPPPDIGQAIDYTSLPYEEPTSMADRFRNASPAVKALVVLVPLVVIGGLIALALAFSQTGTADQTPTPSLPPPELIIERADVAGRGTIQVVGSTNLPDSVRITAVMQENGQDFAWFAGDTATTQPSNGKISLRLTRQEQAPTPSQEQEYTITLVTTVNEQPFSSAPAVLTVSAPNRADFYQLTATEPTPEPTAEPTPEPTTEPTPEPEEPTELTATVLNGGRLRTEPTLEGEEVGQVSKGEVLTLLERSQDGAWYRVSAAEGEGWVSSALLEVTPEVAALVPTTAPTTTLTATVFNGGNVRPGPGLRFNPPLDQINAGETVQLLAKTEDGNWYQIINERNVTGWVNRTLLTISLEVSRQVPVIGPDGTVPTPSTPAATPDPAAPTGLTATVFNGGNVRSAPSVNANPPLDQINAGETVQLLAKTADGRWYQITNIRNVTGWVSVTLLTVDPDVAQQVPVGE